MKIQPFDFSINVLRALLWRHNEAVNLQSIILNKQNALDDLNKDFWGSWFNDVFNIDTANDFGLSVWSIILDVPITVTPDAATANNSSFGFGPFRKNFGNGNFTGSGSEIVLNTEQARLVIRLRFYQLVTRGTIPECNKIVGYVFKNLGEVYALDGNDMTMTYVFKFQPSAQVRFIIREYDLLPRPSGVQVKIVYNPNSSFGFGPFRKNFNNGNFGD